MKRQICKSTKLVEDEELQIADFITWRQVMKQQIRKSTKRTVDEELQIAGFITWRQVMKPAICNRLT